MHIQFVRRFYVFFTVVIMLTTLTGCSVWSDEKGVVNHWRNPELPGFANGQTTRTEVLELLGPPSQIIRVKDGVVFYYLHEQTEGKGYFFLIYNRRDEKIRYDRAIFFFTDDGMLVQHSYSLEQSPYADQ